MLQRRSVPAALAASVLLSGLVFFLRLPTLPLSVIDWDESVYLLMARSMLQGHLPYTVIWDHKPPGLYVLFALTQIVFGQTVLAIRLLAMAAVTTTACLLCLYGYRVLGSWAIGALAALFYAFFSLQNGGMASNAEILFAPFTVAAFLLLGWRTGVPATIRAGRRLTFLSVGLLLGVAIQIKTIAAMELLAVLVLLGLTVLRRQRARQPLHLAEAALAAGLLVVGALLPLLIAAGFFAVHGHFADYVYANFTANAIYLRSTPALALAPAAKALLIQARAAPLLWVALVAAVPWAWMTRRHPSVAPNLLAVGVWLVFALAAALSLRRYFPHYFLQTLPPLSLLAALVIVQAVRLDNELPRLRQALLVGLIVAVGLAQPAAQPLQRSLEEALILLRRTPRIELLAYTADYLRERMAPDDYLFVAEGEPILYYLTGALIPTPYVLPPLLNDDLSPMIGVDPLAELDRIMALQPRYVVLPEEEVNRNAAFFTRLQAHLARSYALERSIQGILLFRLAS